MPPDPDACCGVAGGSADVHIERRMRHMLSGALGPAMESCRQGEANAVKGTLWTAKPYSTGATAVKTRDAPSVAAPGGMIL